MSSIKSIMVGVVLFVIAILFLFPFLPPTLSAKESASVAINALNSTPETTLSGLVDPIGDKQAHPTVFGGQILPSAAITSVITVGVEANLSWIRYDGTNDGVLWSNVEAEQGVRDWDRLSLFEEEISRLSSAGFVPIVVVRSTPSWAQKTPPYYCGPIREDALDDFADFMRELVERYSGPPYNVTYWEIWNEPDIDSLFARPDSYFGCWGNESDPYYGGGYYGEMLKHIYPAMKEANPNVQIVIGGLNLDCDPSNPPAHQDCKAGKFLEGILQNGGGDYFDIVAYHAYAFWSTANVDWDLEHIYWKERGGAVLGKADFLREVLAQFGYEKPLILTETSLLCYEFNPNCPSDEFFAGQANFLIRLYTRLSANNILGATWFCLNYNAWRHSDLLGPNNTPKPAYEAIKFMASLLSGATYKGSLGTSTLEGYSFWNPETNLEYRVYWTNNEKTSESLSLFPSTLTVYDKLGQEITPSESGTIEIGFEPIIIEMETLKFYLPVLRQ